MWTYQGLKVREGKSWTTSDGIQHPTNWDIWTDEQKTEAGLVWVDDPVVSAPIIDLDTQKANAIAFTKKTARELLKETDWQVIKATEVSDYSVPSEVSTYRAAVRTASNTIEAAITGASDQEAFDALGVAPVDENGSPNGNAPIDDWPEEI